MSVNPVVNQSFKKEATNTMIWVKQGFDQGVKQDDVNSQLTQIY
jgi:hypothetical protein